jgi:hypothetical protein
MRMMTSLLNLPSRLSSSGIYQIIFRVTVPWRFTKGANPVTVFTLANLVTTEWGEVGWRPNLTDHQLFFAVLLSGLFILEHLDFKKISEPFRSVLADFWNKKLKKVFNDPRPDHIQIWESVGDVRQTLDILSSLDIN